MTTAIDRFVQAIERAEIPGSAVFAPDAVLDATVPNWRYTIAGAGGIEFELARWYADPGRFEDLSVTEIPGWRTVAVRADLGGSRRAAYVPPGTRADAP